MTSHGSDQRKKKKHLLYRKIQMLCVAYGCFHCSDGEKEKLFFRVPKRLLEVVVHKGERCKKLTEQRCKEWIVTLTVQSGGGWESATAIILYIFHQRRVGELTGFLTS